MCSVPIRKVTRKDNTFRLLSQLGSAHCHATAIDNRKGASGGKCDRPQECAAILPRPENGGATMRYTSLCSPCGCRRTTAGGWNQCELTQLRPAKETAPMAVWFGGGELSAGRRSRYQFKCSSFQSPTTLPESSVKLKYCSAGTIQKSTERVAALRPFD